ncbi:MAG: DUF4405 domain-containing protein [Pseudomonadota bacterium]
MNIRRTTSLTALLSFLLMLLTSVILYIVPQGRVAYWADWRLWGLGKTQWTDIHINLGVIFLIAIVVHIYLNWKPITAYLKNRMRRLTVLTPDFNVAFLLVVAAVAGTYFHVPPFSTILNLNAAIKDRAARIYGDPPYGHAELSTLKTFAGKTQLDLPQSLARLNNAGITGAAPDKTLARIAEENGVAPQRLYIIMKPAQPAEAAATMPSSPPLGTGSRPLADLAAEYHLQLPAVLRLLSDAGITATAQWTLKEIGGKNNLSPMDIYTRIQENHRTLSVN